MLAYILAVVVGTGSVGLYLAAFFLPAVHRKQDFIWSGVGLFYALFLWLYARQVTGGILVGQTTSVVLLGWLTWQLFNFRRQVEPLSQQVSIPGSVNKSTPKAPKSTAQPTDRTSASSTPLADTRVPAKATTTPDRAAKTTSNPTATAANKFTTPVPPVAAEATPRERKAAPAPVGGASPLENRSSQPAITPPAPPAPSNLDSAAAPVKKKTAPAPVGGPVLSVAEVASPLENRTSQPASIPPAPIPQPILAAAEEERAWITLEVKPASVPSPPLGTPAPPPTPQPKIVPEAAPNQNIPTETIEATVKINRQEEKL